MPKTMKIAIICFVTFLSFMFWVNSGKDIYIVDNTGIKTYHSHVRKFAEVHVKEGRLLVDGYVIDILNENYSVLVR